MSRKVKYIIVLILIVVSIGAVAGYRIWNKPPDTVDNKVGIPVTAVELVKEFSADEAAANTKYTGKTLTVTGEVSGMEENQDGGKTILLQGDDPMINVSCAMAKDASSLKNGQTVTIKGDYSAASMLGISLTGCVVE